MVSRVLLDSRGDGVNLQALIALARGPFARNVFAVASGTAAVQAITIAAAPLITRLYGPEAFGVQGIYMSILSVIAPIAALTYPVAIVLPSSAAVACIIAFLSFTISLSVSLLSLLIIVILPNNLRSLLNFDSIGASLYLLPVAIFFTGLHQTLSYWIIRLKKFPAGARNAVQAGILSNAAKITLGILAPFASSLIAVSSLTPVVQSALLWSSLKREQIIRPAEAKRLLHIAHKFRSFPLYRAPEAMLSAFSVAVPILVLGTYMPEAAGFYALARAVLKMPGTLLAKSVGDVLYPRYAEAANNRQKLIQLLWKSISALSLLCAVPFGVVILFGPYLFNLIFGSEWNIAGEYGRWIALWLYVNFTLSPANQIFTVAGRQKLFLFYRISSVIVTTAFLLIGLLAFKSDVAAVALYCISGAVMTITMFLMSLRICGTVAQK